MSIKKVVKALNEIIDLQIKEALDSGQEYHQGLANGLIMAQSIINGKEPLFVKTPNKINQK